jgi:hypothetical protein
VGRVRLAERVVMFEQAPLDEEERLGRCCSQSTQAADRELVQTAGLAALGGDRVRFGRHGVFLQDG